MFADNERISWIQMERQFALAYLGPVVLWTGTGLSGRTGLCSILLGTIFLCVWVFFLLRQVHVYRYPEKYWGRGMSRIIAGIYQIYLILTAGWMIAQISEIITEYFVQGISVWVAAGILTLVSLGGSQNVQARGRFAETAWPVVCLLVGGMFFLAAFQIEPEMWKAAEDSYSIWRLEEGKEILWGMGWFLTMFLGASLIPFLVIQVAPKGGHAGSLFRTIGRIGLWQGAIVLILLGTFGKNGAKALKYPMLDLMAGVRLPGGFIRRIDLIFLTIILFALIFSLGSLFFYSKYIWQRVGLCRGRGIPVIVSFLLGTSPFGRNVFTAEYPRLMLCIFLPFFLILTVCNAFLRRKS